MVVVLFFDQDLFRLDEALDADFDLELVLRGIELVEGSLLLGLQFGLDCMCGVLGLLGLGFLMHSVLMLILVTHSL